MKKNLKKIVVCVLLFGIVGLLVSLFVKINDNHWQDNTQIGGSINPTDYDLIHSQLVQKEEQLNNVNEELVETKNQLNNANQQLQTLSSSLEELENQTSSNTEDIEQNKQAVAEIRQQISSINTTITDLNLTIDSLNVSIETISADILDLRNQLLTLNTNKVRLSGELDYGFEISNGAKRDLATLEITTKGGDLLIIADFTIKVSNYTAGVRVLVDDVMVFQTWTNVGSYITKVLHGVKTNVSAGEHTIKFQAYSSDNMTLYSASYNRSTYTIVEL